MALLFCDSFDHYNSIPQKWPLTTSSGSINAAYGRFSTAGVRCTGGNPPTHLHTQLPNYTATSTIIVGFAVQPVTVINIANDQQYRTIFTCYEGGTQQAGISMNASQQIIVRRANTAIATVTPALLPNRWTYVEVKLKHGDATGVAGTWGSCEIRFDNAVVATFTNIDTLNNGTGVINQIAFGCPSSSGTMAIQYDDIYVCDTSGSYANDYLGDVRVQYLPPTADSSVQFTPLTGSDNYAMVDETGTVNDADYNYTGTSGDIDLFTMADLSGSNLVKGIQVVRRHGKTSNLLIQSRSKLKIGSNVYNGSDKTASMSNAYALEPYSSSPDSGVEWTDTEVNGIEVGYEARP